MIEQTVIDYSKPLIMGILNATPDSFSDGSRYLSTRKALAHGMVMAEQGADIIDVGGESTRPGARPVSAAGQMQRVLGVIRTLRERLPPTILISIDTTLSEVASAALEAGAAIINDISAGRDDPALFQLAASCNTPIVLVHRRGKPETMHVAPEYQDVVREVSEFLCERVEAAQRCGVAKHNIILDPGIGFGKGRGHNLTLLARLDELVKLGYPLLLGTSRKRFMGSLTDIQNPEQLLPATVATSALGVMAGVSVFRVHDVAENRQAVDVSWAIKNALGLR